MEIRSFALLPTCSLIPVNWVALHGISYQFFQSNSLKKDGDR